MKLFLTRGRKKRLAIILSFLLLITNILTNYSKIVLAESEIFYSEEGWEYVITSEENKTVMITGMTYTGKEASEFCLTVPGKIGEYKVTKLGEDCFLDDNNILEVTISEGIEEIGVIAFYGCENLRKVVLPNTLTVLGGRTFAHCLELEEVIIPETFVYSNTDFQETPWYEEKRNEREDGLVVVADTIIDQNGCSGKVTIPEGIKKIASNAFCNNTQITSVIMAETVEEIESSAFEGCTELKTVDLTNGITYIGGQAFDGCTALKEFVFPTEMTKISDNIFKGCTSLEKVTLPETEEQMSTRPFPDLEGLTVVVPKKYKISSYLVNEYKNLHYVVAKGSVMEEYVKNYGKSYETYEAEIELEDGTFRSQDGYWIYKVLESDATAVQLQRMTAEGIGEITHLTIPQSIDGYSVREIGSGLCRNNQWLEEVRIPDGVEQIGNSAFSYCPKLKKVILPEKTIDCINVSAFDECSALAEITFPEEIGYLRKIALNTPWFQSKKQEREDHQVIVNEWLLDGSLCTGKVEVPQGVKYISMYAFENSEIEEISFPDTLVNIGESAFESCSKLNKINFSENASKLRIGSRAFKGCTLLKKVELPIYLTSMWDSSFPSDNELVIWIPVGLVINHFYLKDMTGTFFYVPEGTEAEQYMRKNVPSSSYATYSWETPTPTPETTSTPQASAKPTPEATPKVSESPTPEATPKASESPTPEATPKVSESPTPEATPKVSESPTPEATPKVSESPTSEATFKGSASHGTTEVLNANVSLGKNENTATKNLTKEKKKIYVVKGLKYQILSAKTVAFVGVSNNKRKKLAIPSHIKIKSKKYRVVMVEKNACKSCKKMRIVTIGKNVKRVKAGAFERCTSLQKIVFGEGVQYVDKRVLKNNYSLKMVVFKTKKLKKIGKYVFEGVPKKVVIRTPKSKLQKYKRMIYRIV